MRLSPLRLGLLLASLAAATSTGCSRPPGLFSEPNARAHIGMLAGTIGSRPIGTPANVKARVYITEQLRLFGYEVRVQEADARRAALGLTARVGNIIAVRPGRRSEAIAIVSHYDSVPAGPGAGDDALGVGVSLEAARVLAARADRNWTLMILVTDGEEAGLMGAAALVTDRDVTSRLQAYVNVESIGSAGDPTLFETGPGNGWLVVPWARLAPRPNGASFGLEIYRRLPNDTDFSILKRQGIPGLNFAIVGDSYAYHTTRDTPERLSPLTVRHTGEQVVALMTALDAVDVTRRSDTDRTFFDLGGRTAASYGPAAGAVIGVAALLLGIMAWLRVIAHRDQARRRAAVAAHSAVDARGIGGGHRLDGRRHVGAPPGARGVSPVVRAPGPTVSAPHRRGRHRRLEHRPSRSVAAGAGARRATPDHRVERRAAGVDRARRRHDFSGAWRSVLCGSCLSSPRACSSRSSRSRTPSPCERSLLSSCWSPLRCGCARPSPSAFHGRHLRPAAGRNARCTSTRRSLLLAGIMILPPLVALITKTQPFVRPSLETSIGLLRHRDHRRSRLRGARLHARGTAQAVRARGAGGRRSGGLGRGVRGAGCRSRGGGAARLDAGDFGTSGTSRPSDGFRTRSSFARPDRASARRRSPSLRSPSSRSRPERSWP